MRRLLMAVMVLLAGAVFGSWIAPDQDCELDLLEKWENDVVRLSKMVKLEQARTGAEAKVVACISRHNRRMGDSLRCLIAGTIVEMTRRHSNLKLDTILAVITWETARTWDPRIVSPAGAIGLMQVMPATGRVVAEWEGMDGFAIADLFDPVVNLRLGCRYLSRLIEDYGSLDVALAAYNGGDRNARMFSRRDRASCAEETWHYVPNVLALALAGGMR